METEFSNKQQEVFYYVVHKLTNKPIRTCELDKYNVREFATMQEAEEVCALKNKIMGAGFYKVITMYRQVQS